MGLDAVIQLNISRKSAIVSQTGFGTGLILGSGASFSGVRTYNKLEDVAADFSSSFDEYKAAQSYFANPIKPKQLKIGKRLANVAEVKTITPAVVDEFEYSVTIGETNYSFTSDSDATANEIVAGLLAEINADAGCTMIATGTSTLILTAKVAGFASALSVGDNLSVVITVASVGVPESLSAISAVDDDWYGLILTSKTDSDILMAAGYIESVKKIFAISRADSDIIDPLNTSHIFAKLKAGSYFRTLTRYSATAAKFPEAGMLGKFFPLAPGSEAWFDKTLSGDTVDALTPSNIAALKAQNVNYYVLIGGLNVCQGGKVAGGEWIDVIRLIDLIAARMQEEIFASQVQNDKIPFTNGGITIIQGDVESVLKANQKTGGIAPDDVDPISGDLIPGFTTNFPKVSEISANDRAARSLVVNDAFTARMAGAIVAIEINGNVTT